MMNRKLKRLIAALMSLMVALSLFPSMSNEVLAAITYKNEIFSITGHADADFASFAPKYKDDIDKYVKQDLNANSSTKCVTVNSGNFVTEWNKDTTGQFGVVVIDCHGNDASNTLSDNSEQTMIAISTINKLKYKSIRCIILLACYAGKESAIRTGNLATAFANKFRCPVIAADGKVYKRGFWGCPLKNTGKSSYVNTNGKGWLAFFPMTFNSSQFAMGNAYRWSSTTLSLLEMLRGYGKLRIGQGTFVSTFSPW